MARESVLNAACVLKLFHCNLVQNGGVNGVDEIEFSK